MNLRNVRAVPPSPAENNSAVVDTRISDICQLLPPVALIEKYPTTYEIDDLVFKTRADIAKIMRGQDDRLIVITGPCSIHDPKAALEYAQRLLPLRLKYRDQLEIIMRVYFEKPRTTVGWKGLINDPDLDNSCDINKGLRIARKLLREINAMGMPAGTEFLDIIPPQYIDAFISWGAIGARTAESQVHRELASGLSCPVGIKNATDGAVKIAIDGIIAAEHEHTFMTVTKMGHVAIVHTSGNPDCHLILRGGKVPNYHAADIEQACQALHKAGLPPKVMIDCSHANSEKQFKRQLEVCRDLCAQVAAGNDAIMGVMIESNLHEGRQDLCADLSKLNYGQSITDACVSFEDTELMLGELAAAVQQRRAHKA